MKETTSSPDSLEDPTVPSPTEAPLPEEPSSKRASDLLSGKQLVWIVGLGSLAVIVVGVGCSLVGQYHLTWDIVVGLRLYRVVAAAATGAALSAAGLALQGLLRNPLAEPYVLGISSGAGVGVLLGSALASSLPLPSWATTQILSLAGALLTCALVYGVAQRRGHLNSYSLLLSGVIVNSFNGAVMLSLLLLLDPLRIATFARWAMGELPDAYNRQMLLASVLLIGVGWAGLLWRGAALNALGLGDEVAATCGVAVRRLRVEIFALVAFMASIAVAIAGPIGFLGLIVPHICRLLVGPDHRRLVLISGFAGAIFLMIADTLCRTAGPTVGVGVIPVGIITALTGGPFFIFLLRRRFQEGAP